ncbi:MAG TPA: hypothetical protein VHZ55_02880 [Bryobacteraceae bacterium]|jgi:hypothetical protein|nr:hypothetical protein [Bryobacteraceae bacterium]
MAAPIRSTVTVDGTSFNALSTSVAFTTLKDHAGMPQMGTLATSIMVMVDYHDDTNLPNAALRKLFNLANVVTQDKIKPIKIVFWKDETRQDALASYSFNGWVSHFETSNPISTTSGIQPAGANGTSQATVNHLLTLQLQPALNQQNYGDIQLSN